MRRHRQDVDHRTLDPLADHDLRGFLHQEEGRLYVDGEHLVEERGACVEDGAAVGHAGRVDEDVDPPEGAVRACHDACTSSRLARSAGTNSVRQPFAEMSLATASPRAVLRPQITSPAAPRSARVRAMASPTPWVPPVTTATAFLMNCELEVLRLRHDGMSFVRASGGYISGTRGPRSARGGNGIPQRRLALFTPLAPAGMTKGDDRPWRLPSPIFRSCRKRQPFDCPSVSTTGSKAAAGRRARTSSPCWKRRARDVPSCSSRRPVPARRSPASCRALSSSRSEPDRAGPDARAPHPLHLAPEGARDRHRPQSRGARA